MERSREPALTQCTLKGHGGGGTRAMQAQPSSALRRRLQRPRVPSTPAPLTCTVAGAQCCQEAQRHQQQRALAARKPSGRHPAELLFPAGLALCACATRPHPTAAASGKGSLLPPIPHRAPDTGGGAQVGGLALRMRGLAALERRWFGEATVRSSLPLCSRRRGQSLRFCEGRLRRAQARGEGGCQAWPAGSGAQEPPCAPPSAWFSGRGQGPWISL